MRWLFAQLARVLVLFNSVASSQLCFHRACACLDSTPRRWLVASGSCFFFFFLQEFASDASVWYCMIRSPSDLDYVWALKGKLFASFVFGRKTVTPTELQLRDLHACVHRSSTTTKSSRPSTFGKHSPYCQSPWKPRTFPLQRSMLQPEIAGTV